MPTGKGRPNTRPERDAVRTMNKAKKSASVGEQPTGTKWASSVLSDRDKKEMARAKPKKRDPLAAAGFRIRKAIDKGKSVKR